MRALLTLNHLRGASTKLIAGQSFSSSLFVSRVHQQLTPSKFTVVACTKLFHSSNADLNTEKDSNRTSSTSTSSSYERENLLEQFQNVNEKKLKKYLDQEAKYNGKLIYIGSLTTQLMATKFLSLSSSVLGICLTPFLMTTMTEQSMLSKMFVYATCGFFIFVTPAVFQMLTRKYVSRLYYNYETKTFTAVMFNFFMIEYSMTFKLRDLYVPDVPGVFTTMIAKKTSQNASKSRGLFIDYNLISDIDLVKRILGYDKPIDIEKYKE